MTGNAAVPDQRQEGVRHDRNGLQLRLVLADITFSILPGGCPA
jgi:hypothetical protein